MQSEKTFKTSEPLQFLDAMQRLYLATRFCDEEGIDALEYSYFTYLQGKIVLNNDLVIGPESLKSTGHPCTVLSEVVDKEGTYVRNDKKTLISLPFSKTSFLGYDIMGIDLSQLINEKDYWNVDFHVHDITRENLPWYKRILAPAKDFSLDCCISLRKPDGFVQTDYDRFNYLESALRGMIVDKCSYNDVCSMAESVGREGNRTETLVR